MCPYEEKCIFSKKEEFIACECNSAGKKQILFLYWLSEETKQELQKQIGFCNSHVQSNKKLNPSYESIISGGNSLDTSV